MKHWSAVAADVGSLQVVLLFWKKGHSCPGFVRGGSSGGLRHTAPAVFRAVSCRHTVIPSYVYVLSFSSLVFVLSFLG